MICVTSAAARERLVSAASVLLYQQGVEKTTLADIALAADVPLGNIYYYFKTKEDIVDAVVEAHVRSIEGILSSLDRRHRTPKGRLKALMRELAAQSESVAKYGCPHGTMCSELEKSTKNPDHDAPRLVQVPIVWVEKQFRSMGRPDAHDLAIEFMSTYEGAALLTHALREPELLVHEGRRLERWIDSLEGEALAADKQKTR